MHRSLALVLVYSAKALISLGQNIAPINRKNGGPYSKNSVMRSLLRDSQIIWALETVKARKAEAKVKRAVAKVEVIK